MRKRKPKSKTEVIYNDPAMRAFLNRVMLEKCTDYIEAPEVFVFDPTTPVKPFTPPRVAKRFKS